MVEVTDKTKAKTVDFGSESREKGSQAIRELWASADALQAQETDPERGVWVPWRTIRVNNDILPRERLNPETVESYAATFDKMPPVKVQRGTYVLIGGRTRLESVIPAHRDHIRIVEVDVPDDRLWEEAYADNIKNGQTMTQAERNKAGRRYLREHEDHSNALIADWTGVTPGTVAVWRREEEERKARERAAAAERTKAKVQQEAPAQAPSTNGQPKAADVAAAPATAPAVEPEPEPEPEAPRTRLGRDGRTRTVTAPAANRNRPTPADRARERAEMFQVDLPPLPSETPDVLASALPEHLYAAAAERANRWLDQANQWSDWLAKFAEAVATRTEEATTRAAGEAAPD